MRHALLVIVGIALLVTAAQTQTEPSPSAAKASTQRTAWGDPDLQGIWSWSISTPLERPREFEGKEFLTDDDLARLETQARQRSSRDRRDGIGTDADLTRDYNAFWDDEDKRNTLPNRRTSMIVDPADGRLPSLTPEARSREAARAEANRQRAPADSWLDRSVQERCLIFQIEGPPMLPAAEAYKEALGGRVYNLQIFQAPGYVAILQEFFQELRIIPLDERPHLSQDMRQWQGDSRGHWEGTALVVDTTNFTDKTNVRGAHENLHLIERLTPAGGDTIDYQFTVDDPTTFVRPWSAMFPLTRGRGPLFEFACHEGNHALPNILRGARAQEEAAAQGAKNGSQ